MTNASRPPSWVCMLRSVLVIALACAGARADPLRYDRPTTVGGGLAWPWIVDHDATAPLPGVHLGRQVTSRLGLDASIAVVPYSGGGVLSNLALGARWFLSDRALAPYGGLRVGLYTDSGDETSSRSYPFAAATLGLEYARSGGLVVWAEAGPAAVGYEAGGPRSLALGVYGGLGAGFRIAR